MNKKREEKYLFTILEESPDIVILKDASGKWLQANEKALKIFGIKKENYKGKSDKELAEIYPQHKKHVSLFQKTDNLAFVKKEKIQLENTFTVDEEERTFEIMKKPLYNEKNDPETILVIGRDVTQRIKEEKIYKTMFNEHPDALYSLGKNGMILDINKKAEILTGYSKEEIIGKNFRLFIKKEFVQNLVDGFKNVKDGFSIENEVKMLTKTGEEKDIHLTTIPAMVKGEVVAIQGIAKDITAIKKAEALKENQTLILSMIAQGRKLEEIFKSIVSLVEVQTQQGICSIMRFNEKEEMLNLVYAPNLSSEYKKYVEKVQIGENQGSCGQAAYKKELVIVSDIKNSPSWNNWREKALKEGLVACWSMPVISTDGSLLGTFAIYYKENKKPEKDEIEMLRVISYLTGLAIDRSNHEKEIHRLAHRDTLTDVLNMRGLKEYYNQIIKKTNDLAVVLLDLDKFKTINDSFGHSFGDEVLKKIAKRLLSNLREGDAVARMGGDEFVLFIKNAGGEEKVEMIVNRLLKEIQNPIFINDLEFQISASIGVSIYKKHGYTLESLITSADIAMYHAKNEGGNEQKVYKSIMNESVYEKFILQTNFKKSLKENQFLLHYQPKIDITTKKVIGVEALVRWNHPKEGLISPATFIPLAEESGFITELGEWVIKESCRQINQWKKEHGISLKVAINVSIRQFVQKDMVSIIKTALKEYKLSPDSLEIEITESMFMKHETLIQEAIKNLKEIGIKISIDDFGTGYASLTYLKKLSADEIKIDRSFINSLPLAKDDSAIVCAVIKLASELGLSVIAEGVETIEQLDFLKDKGCKYVQGYYFSKPLSPKELIEYVKKT